MAKAGLLQSMATREPNLDPRKETICLLPHVSDSSEKGLGHHSPHVVRHDLSVLRIGIDQNILDKIVSVLVASD